MDKKFDLEFFDSSGNEEKILGVTKFYDGKEELTFCIKSDSEQVDIILTEKEALELASQIFRNVLGLF